MSYTFLKRNGENRGKRFSRVIYLRFDHEGCMRFAFSRCFLFPTLVSDEIFEVLTNIQNGKMIVHSFVVPEIMIRDETKMQAPCITMSLLQKRLTKIGLFLKRDLAI